MMGAGGLSTIVKSTGVIGQRYWPAPFSRLKPIFVAANMLIIPPLFSIPISKVLPKIPDAPITTWAHRNTHGLSAANAILRNRLLLQSPVPHILPPSLPLPEPPTPKGTGMIHTTLFGILFTDAPISHGTLRLRPQ